MKSLKTICLLLGPYRNLTTLTAAVLSLHPNVQVFNHGAERILGNQEVDFIADYSSDKFQRFCNFVVDASADGQNGSYGGTILKSHAFKKGQLNQLYQARYGEQRSKDVIRSLIWKDSQRITHAMRKHNFDFDRVLEQEKQLRFLMPVRNPLDCAFSNFRTGHYTIFYTGEKNSETNFSQAHQLIASSNNVLNRFETQLDQVMTALVSEYNFFLNLQKRFPERFYFFFENNFSRQTLQAISSFLQIEDDEKWLSDALLAFDVISKPAFSDTLRNKVSSFIDKNLATHGEFKKNLLSLMHSSDMTTRIA